MMSPPIDWSVPPRRPFWLPSRSHVAAVSQLYHGEAAALMLSRRLLAEGSDPARAALRDQAGEEAEHKALLRSYLARLGATDAPATRFDELLGRIDAWAGPPLAILLANNIVLEAEALLVYRKAGAAIGCPLFRQIARHIAADEAQHVRLGRALLRDMMADVEPEGRAAIYRWIKEIWYGAARLVFAEHAALAALICPWGLEGTLNWRWARHEVRLVRWGLLTREVARRL